MNHSVHAAGAAMAFGWLILAQASHGAVPIFVFLLVLGGAWGWWVWSITNKDNYCWSMRSIFGWAVVFRLIAFSADPIYEDDWYRYLWDGWRLTEGLPVYGVAPMDSFGDDRLPLALQRILDGVNYPERPTVYGPVAQLFFGISAWIQAGSLAVLKGVWFGLELLLLGAMFRWARPQGFIIYAWCPLLIFEVFFNAHLELVGLGLLCCGWMLRDRGKWMAAGLLLALAVGARWFAFPLALLLLKDSDRNGWISFIVGCLGVAGLGQILGGTEVGQVWNLLREWEFNSTVFALVQWEIGRNGALTIFALGTVGLWLWAWNRGDAHLGSWVILGLLVLGPVANSWYFLWLLPFAIWRMEAWHLSVMGAVSLSYLCAYNLGGDGYEHPFWLRPMEVACALGGAVWLSGWLVKERDGGGESVVETGVASVNHSAVNE